MENHMYEWIVIGGGAAGIAISEMLSRVGDSVLILEKNDRLAGETTKVFHEWLHSGMLYTLMPDGLPTTRYLLGALDDLAEFYPHFPGMNIDFSSDGLSVNNTQTGWFNNDFISYRFRNHFYDPFWSLRVARTRALIRRVKKHDWLRRRAGSSYDSYTDNQSDLFRSWPRFTRDVSEEESPDFTLNSRPLLSDLLYAYEDAGGVVQTGFNVERIAENGNSVSVFGNKCEIKCKKIVICAADGVERFSKIRATLSYAPLLVVDGLTSEQNSFLELDRNPANCVNLINKGGGIGLAGGISLKSESGVSDYLASCVRRHKEINPDIAVIGSYVGLKKELVLADQNRNYLYHINDVSENVSAVVLGKFTLMFSLAAEFFRRKKLKNPPKKNKFFHEVSQRKIHPLLAQMAWKDIAQSKRGENVHYKDTKSC